MKEDAKRLTRLRRPRLWRMPYTLLTFRFRYAFRETLCKSIKRCSQRRKQNYSVILRLRDFFDGLVRLLYLKHAVNNSIISSIPFFMFL